MDAMINSPDIKALELYSEIQNAANARLGHKHALRELPKVESASILGEYKHVLAMPQDYVHKYKASKLSALICGALPRIGIF